MQGFMGRRRPALACDGLLFFMLGEPSVTTLTQSKPQSGLMLIFSCVCVFFFSAASEAASEKRAEMSQTCLITPKSFQSLRFLPNSATSQEDRLLETWVIKVQQSGPVHVICSSPEKPGFHGVGRNELDSARQKNVSVVCGLEQRGKKSAGVILPQSLNLPALAWRWWQSHTPVQRYLQTCRCRQWRQSENAWQRLGWARNSQRRLRDFDNHIVF